MLIFRLKLSGVHFWLWLLVLLLLSENKLTFILISVPLCGLLEPFLLVVNNYFSSFMKGNWRPILLYHGRWCIRNLGSGLYMLHLLCFNDLGRLGEFPLPLLFSHELCVNELCISLGIDRFCLGPLSWLLHFPFTFVNFVVYPRGSFCWNGFFYDLDRFDWGGDAVIIAGIGEAQFVLEDMNVALKVLLSLLANDLLADDFLLHGATEVIDVVLHFGHLF